MNEFATVTYTSFLGQTRVRPGCSFSLEELRHWGNRNEVPAVIGGKRVLINTVSVTPSRTVGCFIKGSETRVVLVYRPVYNTGDGFVSRGAVG